MPGITPIFAFGVVSLPMLGWLIAAAAPILIHFWSRQKYREMSWAAMEYLLAAMKQQTRRLHFEQWLLLALRTLIIVLLVLAIAEPFVQPGRLVHSSAARTHRVIVIDGSYSMAYKPGKDGKSGNKSRFEAARQLAAQIVEQGRQGDAFSLVLMSSPPRVVVGTAALAHGEMLDEIKSLVRPDTSADLPATVDLLRTLIDRIGDDNPDLLQHEVYFLTDLQRVGWLPRPTSAAKEFHLSSRKLAERAALVIIDLGQPDAENLAVTGLYTLQPMTALSRRIDFQATLKNFGRKTLKRQPLELLVDGKHVARRQVDLAPGGVASASFSYRFETPGDHSVEIRADGDPLEVDNRRWMAVPVRQAVRVLCVDGRPSGDWLDSATDHLVSALWPWLEEPDSAWIRPEVAPESALLERDLAVYDCIFLCNVAQFTSGEARVLNAYLSSGGSLVFFLGDEVLAERYNRELGGDSPGKLRILPARLGAIVSGDQYRLDPLDYRHPIAKEFRGHERAGLLTTPVSKYFRLIVPKDSRAKVALATGSGDPLIVEESIGRGRVLLVATSADDSWTVMPRWPSYPAIIQELLAFCIAAQLQQRNVPVGRPLGASMSAPAVDEPGTMQRPDGSSRTLRLRPEGDYSAWNYSDTMTSGIYTARFGSPVDVSQSFAVNVNTVESNLAQLSVDELRSEVWPDVPFTHQTTWRDTSQPLADPIVRPERLHVWLLYAVLVLLFAETFLAWRFGHHTT